MADINVIHQLNYIKESFVTMLQAAFAHTTTPSRYRFKTKANGQVDPTSGIEIWRISPKQIVKYPCIYIKTGSVVADIQFLGQPNDYLREEHMDLTASYPFVIPESRLVALDDLMVTKPISIIDASGTPFNYIYADPSAGSFTLDNYAELVFNESDAGKAVTANYWTSSDYRIYGGNLKVPVTITVKTMESSVDMEIITDLVVLYTRSVFRDRLLRDNIVYKNIRVSGESQETQPDGRVIFTNEITLECFTEYVHAVDLGLYEFIRNINLTVNDYYSTTPAQAFCYCTSPTPVNVDCLWSRNAQTGVSYPTYEPSNLVISADITSRNLIPNFNTSKIGRASCRERV